MMCTAQDIHMIQAFPMARLTSYDRHHSNAFSFARNPGALGVIEKFSAGIYSERRFMLQELTQVNMMAAIPSSLGNFGIKFQRFGNAGYSETQAGIAYARKLGTMVSLGVGFNYFLRNIPNYKFPSKIIAETGMILHLPGGMSAGVHIYHPAALFMGNNNGDVSSMYSFGLGYAPSEKFLLVADLQKTEDQPVNIHSGFHYRIVHGVSVSAGITSAASSFYLGAGFLLKSIHITVCSAVHPVLGWSPGLMLVYNPSK